MSFVRCTVACLVLMAFLGSCQFFLGTDPKVPVTGLSLNKASTSLIVGGNETLVATVVPINATNQALAWTSSDATKATVSSAGVVTAVAAGTATITATSKDGSFSKGCVVTVTLTAVAVTGLSLDKTTLDLVFPGADSAALVVTVTPGGATTQTVTWASSDTTVATVTNGVVHPLKLGSATITVTSVDAPTVSAGCVVTVASSAMTSTRAWWGPWARLDRSEAWYIASDHLKLPMGGSEEWKSVSATKLATATAAIELVTGSTDLVKVSQSGAVFYLHRRAKQGASFDGTVVSQSGSRALSGLGNISVIIQNALNSVDVQTVKTGTDGSFKLDNAIKGDSYIVTPQVAQADPVTVVATEDGIDVGAITVTAAAVKYNFKVKAVSADNPWLFADGQSHNVTLTVTNTGSMRSLSPIYTLNSSDSRFTISGSLSNNLNSFEPGASQTLTLPITVTSVTGDWEDFAIKVKLEIWNGPVWEDRASLRFYKNDTMTVNLRTDSNGDTHASLFTPSGELFKLWSGMPSLPSMIHSLVVPAAASGYSVILSGATASTESKYALWIGAANAFSPNLAAFISPGSYEPNNDAANAKPVYINDGAPSISYLMVDDMDMYSLFAGKLSPPAGLPTLTVSGSTASLSWAAVPAATKYFVSVNSTVFDVAGTTATSLSGLTYLAGSSFAVRASNAALGYSTSVPAVEDVLVAGGSSASIPNGTTNGTWSVSDFRIGKYEVTQDLYKAVMGKNPSSYQTGAEAPRRPVECVSWYDAIEFCNRLSVLAGLVPVYSYTGSATDPANWPVGWKTTTHNNISQNLSATGYRLPTEAEWEWAARGGTSSAGTTYAGGATVEDVAWISTNSGNTTHAVGGKAPNELGLYDMSGNVYEWCSDWIGSSMTGSNPLGAYSSGMPYRVLRGGSWINNESFAAVSYRNYSSSDYLYYRNYIYFGFRLVVGSP